MLSFAAPAAARQNSTEVKESSPARTHAAYYDGDVVSFIPETIHYRFTPRPLRRRQSDFTVGPWYVGSLLADRKPKDSRHNLYIVSPGTQYHQVDAEEYDHNEIVNDVSKGDKAVEWDIYWAVVLDPGLRSDFRSERDLILAAQESFVPGDLMDFSDIPGEGFLRAFLHIGSLEGLSPYRRTDGTLPRLIIVPANRVILGRIAVPEPSGPSLVTERSSDNLGKH
ncbi:MAG: hypothetical protein ACE14M_06755 [Terriglobales bacterium]